MELLSIPKSLQSMKDPVEKLFYRGDLSLLELPKIAIVGSRKPLAYTRGFVSKLASEIAKRGGVVVSGGAIGVDSVAHQFAGNNTIGIFANSLDLIYPKTSKKIIEKIYANSLALSEYPETTPARGYYFIHRNRIVTALSDAVVIAQADKDSGSMRSAEFAYKQGKPIFVLPHRKGDSEGTNYLLQELKARAIYDIDAFLDELGLPKVQQEHDAFLEYCKEVKEYDTIVLHHAEKLFEYELEGKIEIQNGEVMVL